MRFAERSSTQAAVASGVLAAGIVSLATSGSAYAASAGTAVAYNFRTVDNNNDVTFNQLLGINDSGEITGYLGSGAQRHPNQGYELLSP